MKRITLARAGLIGQFGWLPIILALALVTFSNIAVDLETKFFPVADRFLIRESDSLEFKNPSWIGDELRVYGAFRKARELRVQIHRWVLYRQRRVCNKRKLSL